MSKIKILLVDDDLDILALLKDTLEYHGFEVFEFDHGKKAIEFASNSAFDVLVSDVLMPEITGLELAAQLRNQNLDFRLYFITGYSDINREEFTSLKPNAIVFKPFDMDELALLIKK